jgi:hypothetical protein
MRDNVRLSGRGATPGGATLAQTLYVYDETT